MPVAVIMMSFIERTREEVQKLTGGVGGVPPLLPFPTERSSAKAMRSADSRKSLRQTY
jgi:hypothetical protein